MKYKIQLHHPNDATHINIIGTKKVGKKLFGVAYQVSFKELDNGVDFNRVQKLINKRLNQIVRRIK